MSGNPYHTRQNILGHGKGPQNFRANSQQPSRQLSNISGPGHNNGFPFNQNAPRTSYPHHSHHPANYGRRVLSRDENSLILESHQAHDTHGQNQFVQQNLPAPTIPNLSTQHRGNYPIHNGKIGVAQNPGIDFESSAQGYGEDGDLKYDRGDLMPSPQPDIEYLSQFGSRPADPYQQGVCTPVQPQQHKIYSGPFATPQHPAAMLPHSTSAEHSFNTLNTVQPESQGDPQGPSDEGRTSAPTPFAGRSTTQKEKQTCAEPKCNRGRKSGMELCQRHQDKWDRNNAEPPRFQFESKMDFSAAHGIVYPRQEGIAGPRQDDSIPWNDHEDSWVQRFLRAAGTPFVAQAKEDELDSESKFLLKQHRIFCGKAAMERGPGERYNNLMTNARMRMLFQTARIFHMGGDSVYPTGGDSGGYGRPDFTMSFGERLRKIEEAMRVNKLIVMDVVEGRGVIALVEHPDRFEKRKIQNKNSNQEKEKVLGPHRQKHGKGKKKATAAEMDEQQDDEGTMAVDESAHASVAPMMEDAEDADTEDADAEDADTEETPAPERLLNAMEFGTQKRKRSEPGEPVARSEAQRAATGEHGLFLYGENNHPSFEGGGGPALTQWSSGQLNAGPYADTSGAGQADADEARGGTAPLNLANAAPAHEQFQGNEPSQGGQEVAPQDDGIDWDLVFAPYADGDEEHWFQLTG